MSTTKYQFEVVKYHSKPITKIHEQNHLKDNFFNYGLHRNFPSHNSNPQAWTRDKEYIGGSQHNKKNTSSEKRFKINIKKNNYYSSEYIYI